MDLEHVSPLLGPDDPHPGDVVRVTPRITVEDILDMCGEPVWRDELDDVVALAGVVAEVVDVECAPSGQPVWRLAGVAPLLFADEIVMVQP